MPQFLNVKSREREFIGWRHRCGQSNNISSPPDSQVRYLKCWQNSKLLEFKIFTIQVSNLPFPSDVWNSQTFCIHNERDRDFGKFWAFCNFWDFAGNFCPRMFCPLANCGKQVQTVECKISSIEQKHPCLILFAIVLNF